MTDRRPTLKTGAAQLVLELGHEVSHAEDDFILGDGNRLAYAHVQRYPDWAEPLTLLMGPPKTGKSHLARIFAERSGAHFAEPDTIGAIARGTGAGAIIVEHVDTGNYEETELFHLLNQSMRDRRAVLMTAASPVEAWPLATQDVKSRVRRAVSFTLALTDDIHLSQMMMKLLADRQLTVEPKVVTYVMARMERSTEEVVALVDTMDRLALTRQSPITRTIAAQALDLRRQNHGEPMPNHPESHDDE